MSTEESGERREENYRREWKRKTELRNLRWTIRNNLLLPRLSRIGFAIAIAKITARGCHKGCNARWREIAKGTTVGLAWRQAGR